MKKKNKIILSGGGTGGHIYPALAIADELKKKLKNTEILFIGSKNSIEMKKVPQFGYPIIGLWISGLKNKKFKDLYLLPLKIIYSFWRSYFIIKKFKPDIVIGTGGYASGVFLYTAAKQKIPILIQEQNSIPGLTNKKLSKYAEIIFTAYDNTKYFLPKKKIFCLGNPLRNNIINNNYYNKKFSKKFFLDPKKPIILSLGGSQGSDIINQAWIKGIKKIIDNNIQLIWQCGEKNLEKIKKKIKINYEYIYITDFIDNLSDAYSAADLIVSRAGALTLSELSIVGKPTIIIPYSHASNNHQYKNAKEFVKKKAILMIDDDKVENELINKILNILKKEKLKNKISKNLLSLSKPRATENIVKEIIKLLI